MRIQSVLDEAFRAYGHVVEGYDWTELLDTLRAVSEKPSDSVVYVPGDEALEALPVAKSLETGLYGGMPIQIGYCNGNNRTLNCLEYHRGSEINIAADDVILLLAQKSKVRDHRLDTDVVEAFRLPKGTAVLLYETALHYAPCTYKNSGGFRVVIVLPRGTNLPKPDAAAETDEDQLLWAANKWLLAHPASPEADSGAWIGLTGENIVL